MAITVLAVIFYNQNKINIANKKFLYVIINLKKIKRNNSG